jgi:hypothetical protein
LSHSFLLGWIKIIQKPKRKQLLEFTQPESSFDFTIL